MRPTPESAEIIGRRHPEWQEHQLRWRWMLDSLEGGERYRQATYGIDRRGLPIRNLVRHKREYPDPRDMPGLPSDPGSPFAGGLGADPAGLATDDDYELRRARTPVPTFVAEAIETHLSRLFAREVKRSGPDELMAWWADVDGCGTTDRPLDDRDRRPTAPDSRPARPVHGPSPGARRRGGRDPRRRRAAGAGPLPRLDHPAGEYALVAARRHRPALPRMPRAGGRRAGPGGRSPLSSLDGRGVDPLHDRRRSRLDHPAPLRPRADRSGLRRPQAALPEHRPVSLRGGRRAPARVLQPRLGADPLRHDPGPPLLQGPEDFIQADGTIPIGPSWLLPKKKNTSGGAATYEGFDVVDFPKDGADSIRKNKADLRDDVDRDSALVKPTGRDGVAQSGLSKVMDHSDGNNRLAKIAKMLARAERARGRAGPDRARRRRDPPGPDRDGRDRLPDGVRPLHRRATWPRRPASFQTLVAQAGRLPITEGLMLGRLMRLCLPGLNDAPIRAMRRRDRRVPRRPRRRNRPPSRSISPLKKPLYDFGRRREVALPLVEGYHRPPTRVGSRTSLPRDLQ